tara:strand:- start:2580 stop:2816 length:237 start_codon:yes stop_codon:yes gene_type:complete
MKYEVLIGFMVKDDIFEVGDVLNEDQIPKKSKKLLIEQGVIAKVVENKKRARNEKGHFIADDPSTEVNEAYEKEEEEE